MRTITGLANKSDGQELDLAERPTVKKDLGANSTQVFFRVNMTQYSVKALFQKQREYAFDPLLLR